MAPLDPASLSSGDNVLPPYKEYPPTSFLSTGTYNASDYGAKWTDPPGTLLPCGSQLGGKKNKTHKHGIQMKKKALKKKHKWSAKYKKSINCKKPKGFSQKQHCKYGRKKMTVRRRKTARK